MELWALVMLVNTYSYIRASPVTSLMFAVLRDRNLQLRCVYLQVYLVQELRIGVYLVTVVFCGVWFLLDLHLIDQRSHLSSGSWDSLLEIRNFHSLWSWLLISWYSSSA